MATNTRTAADVPPVIAAEYSKQHTPDAVAQATGDGYTTTAPMRKAQTNMKSASQYGLPRSGKPRQNPNRNKPPTI